MLAFKHLMTTGSSDVFVYNAPGGGSVNARNLRSEALAAGWSGFSRLRIVVTGPTGSLLIAGEFPVGVELVNNSVITGSLEGATALTVTTSAVVQFTNNGTIRGAGGRGGNGVGLRVRVSFDAPADKPMQPGQGGDGESFLSSRGNGAPGVTDSTIGPSLGPSVTYYWHTSGAGGAGGSFGQPGSAGSSSYTTERQEYVTATTPASSGFSAGYAIEGMARLNVVTLGTIVGPTT